MTNIPKRDLKDKSKHELSMTSGLHTAFTLRLVSCYLFFFGLIGIISLFSQIYGVADLYSIWSFRIADPPWLPPSFSPVNIAGIHTFGDFQLPYYLAKDKNPYVWDFYNATLPLGLFSYTIWGFFGIKQATFLFLAVSTIYFWFVLKLIFCKFSNEHAFLFATIFTFCSIPTLINLDRGGSQMLAYAAFVHAFLLTDSSKNRGRTYLALFLFGFALSLKIYLAIPLVLVFIYKNQKVIYRVILLLAVTNVLLSFFYGGPLKVFKGLMTAYIWQTGESDPGWIFGGVSLSKFFTSLYFYTHTPNEVEQFAMQVQNFVFLPGIIYLILLLILFKLQGARMHSHYRVALSISTVFLVTPVSLSYTLVACSLIVAFGLSALSFRRIQGSRYSEYALILVSTISLLPIPSMYYQTFIPGLWLVHILASIGNAWRYRHTRNEY